MPNPISAEDLNYFISVAAHSISEICRTSSNVNFKNEISSLLRVPILDVENEISNILTSVWTNDSTVVTEESCTKRRKIMANFGASEFDSLFKDME